MSLKEWYRLLLEEVIMVEVRNSSEYTPCRVELLHHNTDWESVWRRSRLSGLSSEFSSFLYRILHDLLPTKERQHRISPSTSSVCSLCPSNSVESLVHAGPVPRGPGCTPSGPRWRARWPWSGRPGIELQEKTFL